MHTEGTYFHEISCIVRGGGGVNFSGIVLRPITPKKYIHTYLLYTFYVYCRLCLYSVQVYCRLCLTNSVIYHYNYFREAVVFFSVRKIELVREAAKKVLLLCPFKNLNYFT